MLRLPHLAHRRADSLVVLVRRPDEAVAGDLAAACETRFEDAGVD